MVMLTLGRSEAMFDEGRFPDAPDEVPGSVIELGPFEYVGLTYNLLRIGPEGDVIGCFKDGLWWLDNNPYPFSDLDVYHDKL